MEIVRMGSSFRQGWERRGADRCKGNRRFLDFARNDKLMVIDAKGKSRFLGFACNDGALGNDRTLSE
jgi:hypothetical protein